ncbi:hypothetical protein CLAFUW4_06793 [Fulvia fulva]|uniref:Uncharacterized protein n=1 Tax=Passalora fulva TaxID=5499 RepID=A0A9Q8PB70_PASFU|nr:uncharacterized protein CLAFUR5_06930 [Fulvia fulva]KAK4621986.1 hypothetical protein CLAFUR4_06801 [Fulvia fulva]KAK4623262.1 hypothetical protein CLAFUR0_06796 [Fulvia fulva]UJO19252.1 hypothetical protein CLAFUR5_06930 [Fulvia fulva]WPV15925.1 hypothetical protein CLAFUW4_06793 [Fulvia fulva]WPV30842.1 hypothetical protein CLAFUW7_06792 [Fulvia fulva]
MVCEYDTSKRTGRTPYQSSKAAQRDRQATDASTNTADEDVLMISMSDVAPESIAQDSQYLLDQPMLPSPFDFGNQDLFTEMDFSTGKWDDFFDSPVSTDPGFLGDSLDYFSLQSQQATHSSTAVAPQRPRAHMDHQNHSISNTAGSTSSESRTQDLHRQNRSMLDNGTAMIPANALNINHESDLDLGTFPTPAAPQCCLTTTLGVILQLNLNDYFGCTRPESSYQPQFRRNVD